MNILITEPKDYSLKALSIYKKTGKVFFFPELKGGQRDSVLNSSEVLVVRLVHKINNEWFDKMPSLKMIATPTTGLNHIDVQGAEKRGIKIISLRGYIKFLKDIPSTAEETMALMLALVRNIPWAYEDVKKGRWDRDAWRGHQLIHKTLGLVGCGRLAKIIAKYARAFGMNVLGYDPYVSKKDMERYGIKKIDLNTLLKMSDIISLHVLLTDKTHNLLKEKHFKIMKPSAYFINTARGEIIKRDALYKALKNKWIKGAAIDVMSEEDSKGRHLKKDPLVSYAKKNKNLIIVPHIGGATIEAMHATEEFVAELVRKIFK
ncbi:MAG: hypothetical protein COU46_03025 [Candidatus Niyogibacteria bacterium CG10_big_fil_rev_8_21_14_0_10_42_19]|uniref:Hydroxyacid dehydrogenase n=1 Tax=Candidatus Niyogibacteria bacterium CG10_big_fil_rev_8_21_14_0_10_42_19 TaxID=1974725 RepID=A0A2H0TF37_9BACT|nr:MAG: hypothetical protein COU46_03025 [Candidatus Niyogibacteria bacterium CG10_big_fil_rev_8_21_14_0_10_42_19]